MRRIAKCVIITICASVLYNINAQICENNYIESIYEKLPPAVKLCGEGVVKGFKVDIQQNQRGVITTLGINMPILEGDSTLVGLFIRRYFLDLILADKEIDIKNVLDRNKSKLFYNGAEYQKGPYWSLPNGLSLLNQCVSFNMNRDSLHYKVQWRDSANNTLALNFPANVQIITGKDKSELESEIESLFVRHRDTMSVGSISSDASLYKETKDGVYAKDGESFLLSEMTNTTYYTKNDRGNFEVIYSPDMLAPSLLNILLLRTEQGDKTTIKVEQRMYGNEIKTFDISTNTLRSFCETNGFNSYIGVESVAEDKIEATLLLHNAELNYLHMFHVATNVNSLFGTEDKFMSARLFSYIPFDNISDLFKEYIDSKEKIKL
ncbi:MAG: hypothetical protein SNJ29_10835 [Rikenellaceae bacterium]